MALCAAALAPATGSVHIGGVFEVGDRHPLHLAEELAVADQILGGRLAAAIAPAPGTVRLWEEAVELLLAAAAPRPFRHPGPTWPTPANLPDNVFNLEERLRVTPTAFALEPTLWLAAGADEPVRGRAVELAGEFGLSLLSGPLSVTAADAETAARAAVEQVGQAWDSVDTRLGRAARRLRRPALLTAPDPPAGSSGPLDADALIAALRAHQRRWGLDIAVLRLPWAPTDPRWTEAMDQLAGQVRSAVALDRLPPGLAEFWRDGGLAPAGPARPPV